MKEAIRAARLKAGLTQEQASEGICSLQMLSRIETGRTEVSYGTFVALMERIGEKEICFFPAFVDREEYEFYRNMKYIWLCLDSWQLDAAYEGLKKLAGNRWLEEPLYCQEWMLLYSRLQFCSCSYSHQLNYDRLMQALHLTRPGAELEKIQSFLLTRNEIHILTALAQEAVYLEKLEVALLLHEQISRHLADSSLPIREKERLQAEDAIVYTKYLIALKEDAEALKTAEAARHKMAGCEEAAQLLELTFLTGLCCLKAGDRETADFHIKAAFYTAWALGSSYAIPWISYLEAETDYPLTERMRSLQGMPLKEYSITEVHHVADQVRQKERKKEFSFSIGDLIRERRQEQAISQQMLCRGLCSKSKLSKIENGTQEPEIMLARTLLQRLGVSDGLFKFYGSSRNAKFFELEYKVLHANIESEEMKENWLNEMAGLIGEKENHLYRQKYLLTKIKNFDQAEETIAMLLEALHITLPDFDIHKICDYRLSWCELSILNNIALAYRRTEETYLCTVYYSQIQAYARAMDLDFLMRINILPFTKYGYVRTLYLKELYQEALSVADDVDILIMKSQIGAYSNYLFFYSQVLAECGRFEEAKAKALMACGLQNILEYPINADVLQQAFLQDFSMNLEY